MQKLHFDSDYMEGAHESILKRIQEINYEHLSGYGTDKYSEAAKEKIRKLIGNDNAEIYFLVGGTQTNQVMIDTMLDSYQGVISASTGHISVHEAGAIEFTGHKVISIDSDNGKLDIDKIERFCKYFYEDENKEVPKPSKIEDIKTDGIVSLVVADTDEWRKLVDNKAVKKTLTIPSWLNTKAEKAAINFSQTLQDALCSKLGVSL